MKHLPLLLLLCGCAGEPYVDDGYADVPTCESVTVSRGTGSRHWPECVVRVWGL